MGVELVLAGIGVACLGVLSVLFLGLERTLIVGVLLTVTIGPVGLIELAPYPPADIVGIAQPVPTITSYALCLSVGVVYVFYSRRSVPSLALIGASLFFLATGAVAVWDPSPSVISGLIHAALVAVAWIVGVGFRDYFSKDAPHARFTTLVLLFISLVLALPAWLQWLLGMGVIGYGDRVGGIYAHPSTLGKVAVVVMCLALPMTRSKMVSVARPATYAAVLSAVSVAPTLSRANIIAVVLVGGGWVLINASKLRLRSILLIAVLFAVGAIVFGSQLINRFAADPEGNERPELLAAALRHLPDVWLSGVGPNNYVNWFEQLEPIVAETGYPVHNIFALYVAEFGLLGVIAFCIPFILCLRAAFSVTNRKLGGKPYADALALLLIAVMFIGWSGWGILRQPLPELIALAAGALWANARRGESQWVAKSRTLSLLGNSNRMESVA